MPSTNRLRAIGRPPDRRAAPRRRPPGSSGRRRPWCSPLGEVDLARVGDRHLATADPEDLLFRGHARHDTPRHVRQRRCGPIDGLSIRRPPVRREVKARRRRPHRRRDQPMQYALLIYGAEPTERLPRTSGPRRWQATTPSPSTSATRGAAQGRRGARTRPPPPRPSASSTARRSRPTGRSPRRRRRSAVLPGRGRRPRRGDRLRGDDPGREDRLRRGPAVWDYGRGRGAAGAASAGELTRRRPSQAADRAGRRPRGRRPPVPRGAGPGGRDADPGHSATSTSPRRPSRTRSSAPSRPGRSAASRPTPGAWITTTARNRAIDRLRRRKRLVEKTEVARPRGGARGGAARRSTPDAAEDADARSPTTGCGSSSRAAIRRSRWTPGSR